MDEGGLVQVAVWVRGEVSGREGTAREPSRGDGEVSFVEENLLILIAIHTCRLGREEDLLGDGEPYSCIVVWFLLILWELAGNSKVYCRG